MGSCLKSCPRGYFENKFDQVCTKCRINQFEENLNGNTQCLNCDEICQTCKGAKTNCTSCKKGNYSFEGNCLKSCPSQYFANGELGKCLACHEKCENCSGLSNKSCLSCANGLFLHEGFCIEECPKGYYADYIDHNCKKCHTSCKNCLNGDEFSCIGECVESREFKIEKNFNLTLNIGKCVCRIGFFEASFENCICKKNN
jgi:proprotein convertase subtilisin/kexin type 5